MKDINLREAYLLGQNPEISPEVNIPLSCNEKLIHYIAVTEARISPGKLILEEEKIGGVMAPPAALK